MMLCLRLRLRRLSSKIVNLDHCLRSTCRKNHISRRMSCRFHLHPPVQTQNFSDSLKLSARRHFPSLPSMVKSTYVFQVQKRQSRRPCLGRVLVKRRHTTTATARSATSTLERETLTLPTPDRGSHRAITKPRRDRLKILCLGHLQVEPDGTVTMQGRIHSRTTHGTSALHLVSCIEHPSDLIIFDLHLSVSLPNCSRYFQSVGSIRSIVHEAFMAFDRSLSGITSHLGV